MAESMEVPEPADEDYDKLVEELYDDPPQPHSDGKTTVQNSGSTSESNSANVADKPMNNKEDPFSLNQIPGTENTTVLFRVPEYVSMSHQTQKPIMQTSRFSNQPGEGENGTSVNEQAEVRYQAPLNITWDMVHGLEAGD